MDTSIQLRNWGENQLNNLSVGLKQRRNIYQYVVQATLMFAKFNKANGAKMTVPWGTAYSEGIMNCAQYTF